MRVIESPYPLKDVEVPATRFINRLIHELNGPGNTVEMDFCGSDAQWQRIVELASHFFNQRKHLLYRCNAQTRCIAAIDFGHAIHSSTRQLFACLGWQASSASD